MISVAPGNAGTSGIANNIPLTTDSIDELAQIADTLRSDLTIVGPEIPLSKGIVDLFQERGYPIFGPTRAASRIESSKSFARYLMKGYNIPSPKFKVFTNHSSALNFINNHNGPIVVKADGLAGGKGVFVCPTASSAKSAVDKCMKDKLFGLSGHKIVLEEHLEGPEVSVFTFTDGENISPLIAACDYKRLLDRDNGPNTGGMGAFSPPNFWSAQLETIVRNKILVPILKGLKQEGSLYKGIIYAGIMLTDTGPKVLEFNCRFGDPEAQVILPMLKTDLVDVALATLNNTIADIPMDWETSTSVGVVMASKGYPDSHEDGVCIEGIDSVGDEVMVFQAGTQMRGEKIVTHGGRILTVVSVDQTIDQARQKVYDNLSRIRFTGAQFRSDIGLTAKTTF